MENSGNLQIKSQELHQMTEVSWYIHCQSFGISLTRINKLKIELTMLTKLTMLTMLLLIMLTKVYLQYVKELESTERELRGKLELYQKSTVNGDNRTNIS